MKMKLKNRSHRYDIMKYYLAADSAPHSAPYSKM